MALPLNFDTDKADFQSQIERFKAESKTYQRLVDGLENVLRESIQALGVQALIQSRIKSLGSFAEKIGRPEKNYTDAINQISDLCGFRIITHTLSEVTTVGVFIKNHFDVIKEETDNKLDLLPPDQFGYLSQHYVVRLKSGVFSDEKIPRDLLVKQLKIEIQVRTLLQHTWADIAHGLSYKSKIELPDFWQRELMRLAAILEEADKEFDKLKSDALAYVAEYDKHHSTEELEQAIAHYQLLLSLEPQNVQLAQDLARKARAMGWWGLAISTLEPFSGCSVASLLRDLGVCLCKLQGDNPNSSEFERGQAFLCRATELNPLDVDAWSSLAGSWRTRELAEPSDSGNERRQLFRQQARQSYNQAFQIDQANSYALGNFIEYEITEHKGIDLIPYFRPSIQDAIKRCKAQAAGQINLPWAFFDLGKFYLFLQDPQAAFVNYAKGVATCTAGYQIDSALKSFVAPEAGGVFFQRSNELRYLLEIARAFRFEGASRLTLKPSEISFSINEPVIIVAGHCGSSLRMEHRAAFIEAFNEFSGTVISGGSRAGIAEWVGDIQEKYPDLQTIGYLPKWDSLPSTVQIDRRYHHLISTDGEDFSVLEPLQYWRDLLQSGIQLEHIRLLAVGGGVISGLEVNMALALGIQVGILESAEGTPVEVLKDLFWNDKQFKPVGLTTSQIAGFCKGNLPAANRLV